jgi:hypothetical protein
MSRPILARGNTAHALTPAETAKYTEELLESLKKIATRQGQTLLAHILELAELEARAQSRPHPHDTRLPE